MFLFLHSITYLLNYLSLNLCLGTSFAECVISSSFPLLMINFFQIVTIILPTLNFLPSCLCVSDITEFRMIDDCTILLQESLVNQIHSGLLNEHMPITVLSLNTSDCFQVKWLRFVDDRTWKYSDQHTKVDWWSTNIVQINTIFSCPIHVTASRIC